MNTLSLTHAHIKAKVNRAQHMELIFKILFLHAFVNGSKLNHMTQTHHIQLHKWCHDWTNLCEKSCKYRRWIVIERFSRKVEHKCSIYSQQFVN